MLIKTRRLLISYAAAAAILLVLVLSITRDAGFALIVTLVLIGILGLHFTLYTTFSRVSRRLREALKPKPYWVPRIFLIYVINGILIIFAYRVTKFGLAKEALFLYLLGIVAFIVEIILYRRNGHSIQDLLYFPSYARLRERKGTTYWAQSILFTIIVFALIIMLYIDCMLLIVNIYQMLLV